MDAGAERDRRGRRRRAGGAAGVQSAAGGDRGRAGSTRGVERPARPRSRRSRLGGRRTTASRRSSSCPSGASGRPRSGSSARRCASVVGRARTACGLTAAEVDELLARLAGPRRADAASGRRSRGATCCRRSPAGLPPAATSGSTSWSGSPTGSSARSAWSCSPTASRAARSSTFDGRPMPAVPTRAALLDARAAGARAASARLRATDSRGARCGTSVGRSSVERALRRGRRSRTSRPRWCGGSCSTATASRSWSGRPGPGRRSRSPRRARRGRAAGTAWSARALARRAASELEDGAGIESTSVAALLEELRRRPSDARCRDGRCSWSTRPGWCRRGSWPSSSTTSERCGAKLVLVGDDRQLPEIGAGGTFGALARRLPAIELRENRRQSAVWEREALALLRDGDADGAVRRYAARGRIVADAGRRRGAASARRRLVAGRRPGRRGDDRPPAARRRRPERARARADAGGRRAARARVAIGDVRVAVGDRVVLRRNDRRLGVVNGDRGIVVGVEERRARWSSCAGGRVRLGSGVPRPGARRSSSGTRSPATRRRG